MSVHQGALIIDLEGIELTLAEKELIRHPLIGGIILFARNYQSPAQVSSLVQQIRENSSRELLITVDQEGGRVQRFRQDFFELPAIATIGKFYLTEPQQASELARAYGWLMAAEVRSVGVNASFAPVLDLQNELSQVLFDRCFHNDPNTVSVLAECYIDGMQSAGMAATGKHFPGHGGVVGDSHVESPVDTREFDVLWQNDLKPYYTLSNQYLSGIMTAHVTYPAVDEQLVTYSSVWLKDIIREKMEFNGLIFSDDLTMQGARIPGEMPARVELSVAAGCDMVLICNDRASVLQTLEQVPVNTTEVSTNRLQPFLKKFDTSWPELKKTNRWQQTIDQIQQLSALKVAI